MTTPTATADAVVALGKLSLEFGRVDRITPTLRQPSQADRDAKARREELAYLRIAEDFALRLPWLAVTIADYELRRTPEARYVKAMDKLLPKITHVLNGCVTVHAQRMDRQQLADRYDDQFKELWSYASDFEPLFSLRAELVEMVMERMPGGTP